MNRRYPLMLGRRQIAVLDAALTEYAIRLGTEVASGDPSAIREQQIALNLRQALRRMIRAFGLPGTV